MEVIVSYYWEGKKLKDLNDLIKHISEFSKYKHIEDIYGNYFRDIATSDYLELYELILYKLFKEFRPEFSYNHIFNLDSFKTIITNFFNKKREDELKGFIKKNKDFFDKNNTFTLSDFINFKNNTKEAEILKIYLEFLVDYGK